MWLKIEADVNCEFRITWGNKRGHYPHCYKVGADAIRQCARNMRAQLELLAHSCDSQDPGERFIILKALAKAGESLRYLLFLDRAQPQAMRRLESWFKAEYDAGDRQLSIQADSSIHVPWGLIFDGPLPTARHDDGGELDEPAQRVREIETFRGFWSLKFSLSAAQSGNSRPRAQMTRSRESFGLLSLVNSEVQSEIKHHLEPAAFADLEQLLSSPIGKAEDLTKFEELISAAAQTDILFYFLGHNRNATLEIGNGKTLDYVAFERLIDSLTNREVAENADPCGLVFLNACESALGDTDINLRSASSRYEFCGVIATESIVPRDYAARFGGRFLRALVRQGKTVGEIMGELHHDASLWPQSLLYGCYADPDYCIERPA